MTKDEKNKLEEERLLFKLHKPTIMVNGHDGERAFSMTLDEYMKYERKFPKRKASEELNIHDI